MSATIAPSKASHELRVIWVAPTVWKRHFDLLKQDKASSRAKAAAVFPAYEQLFARAKDDGLAEAALMAMWGVTNGPLHQDRNFENGK